jgi:small redox-active disulfide protein 2
MITIKILGPGCANCRRLEEQSRKAAQELGIDAEIVKVSDTEGILAYDVLATPGLVINEKLVSSGRIPSPAAIAGWIKEAAA